MKIAPLDVVKYILYKCTFYGDVITNLKMQKLLYFVYVWHLVKVGKPIFGEKFQAWPNGPVLSSVYQELKQFGALPIDPDYSGLTSEEDYQILLEKIGDKKDLIEEVYEKYGALSPFELVNVTHQEDSWQKARKGMDDGQSSNIELSDKDIIGQYE